MMNGFFVSITNNLLEDKHFERMGNAVWLYMWLIDRMTEISEGQGIVNNGHPITYEMVQANFSTISVRTYRRMIDTLREAGYINTMRSPAGLYITINKAKKQFGKKATKTDVPKTVKEPKKGSAKNGTSLAKSSAKSDTSDVPKLSEGSAKNGTSIYIDNNTNTNTINNNNIGDESPDVKEAIKKLYYECIKAYKLPVLNHNTLRAKINAMVREDDPETIIKYLTFMRDQYPKLEMSYKPRIANALDFYTKRIQIKEAITDEVKSQQQSRAWRPKSKGTKP